VIVFTPIDVHGQNELSTKNKKAIRKYNLALEYMSELDEGNAKRVLLESIEKDPDFVEAYLLLADIFNYGSDYEREVQLYRKVSEIKQMTDQRFYYSWGLAEWYTGNYVESRKLLNKYLSLNPLSKSLIDQTLEIIKNCDFSIASINDSLKVVLSNVGDSINTNYDEYFPGISADGNILVITTRIPVSRGIVYNKYNSQEDFYISYKKDGSWTKARSLIGPVNTNGNEGAQSLSADGNIMYFTACGRNDSFGSCDIYMSENKNNAWTKPINIGNPVNSVFWESTPYLAADKRTIYFSSNRPGGYGNMDIWKSTINNEGKWTEPVNLGENINTMADELSPFIHPDGQTLYFSSDGKTGLGGFDLYISRINIEGLWEKTENLGYPINTYRDEQSIVINSIGDLAYISSDRERNKGKDIFSFSLPEKLRPKPVRSWITGEKIFPGESLVLNNVFFKTDSFSLDSTSYPELENLCNFMKANQEINIEIRGHTDNTGTMEYNMELSENRAGEVYKYLIIKGIAPNRITYRGFGPTIPRANNRTEEGRALNRRTEFIILE